MSDNEYLDVNEKGEKGTDTLTPLSSEG